MNTRGWILGVLSVFFVGIVLFYVFFGGGDGVLPPISQTNFPESGGIAPALPAESPLTQKTPGDSFTLTIFEEQPDKKELDSVFMEDIFTVFRPFGEFTQGFAPPAGTFSKVSQGDLGESGKPPDSLSEPVIVTKEELFKYGYPPEYTKILRDLNSDLIESEFLSSNEIYSLDSMENVIKFKDRFADFLAELVIEETEEPAFTAADIEKYRKVYRETLPKLWEEEIKTRKAREQSFFAPLRLWYEFRIAFLAIESKIALDDLKSNFLGLISVAKANHHMSPECYRESSPNNIRGSQRDASCCNCGYTRRRHRWIYVHDCGHNGENCSYQIGCLNNACANLPAIWDPGTGICGCYE